MTTSPAPAPEDPATATPVPAAERAYQHTKDAIIRGELPGGTVISEVTVCKELGISRTPAHEAFLRLAAEELLTLEPRKGAVVRPMPPSEAADVLQMREVIESAAARRVIDDGHAADAAVALEEPLRRQAEALDAEPLTPEAVDAFVTADDAFHSAVVAASRNPIAVHFMSLLRDRQQRLRHQLMRVRPDQLRPALEQHRLLAEALAAGDAQLYATRLSDHIAMHQGIL